MLPGNGTFQIGGFTAPTQASFFVTWTPYPGFDHTDFAVGSLSATVNGAAFSIYDNVGTCPAPYCGPSSTVSDNVYGTHVGPWGQSTFSLASAELTISSLVGVAMFHDAGDNNPDPIGPPGNYSIVVTLPDGLYVTPLPSTLALFAGGLGVLGLLSHRSKRKVDASTGK